MYGFGADVPVDTTTPAVPPPPCACPPSYTFDATSNTCLPPTGGKGGPVPCTAAGTPADAATGTPWGTYALIGGAVLVGYLLFFRK